MTTDVTGRDGYIMIQALCYAIAAIERLPEHRQEGSNHADMIELLHAKCPDKRTRDLLFHEAVSHLEPWDNELPPGAGVPLGT